MVDIPGGGRPWGNLRFSDSEYITLRNSEIRGDGTNSSGGSAVSMSDVSFMVTFQVQIHTAGSWQSNGTGLDVHGWRPAYNNRYLWLLDSELYHLQADGVQTGNSNNQNPQSASSHYVFIGGNLFYENYENALDNKNSYHVVFSSNEVREHYAAADASGANATAVILSNNSRGTVDRLPLGDQQPHPRLRSGDPRFRLGGGREELHHRQHGLERHHVVHPGQQRQQPGAVDRQQHGERLRHRLRRVSAGQQRQALHPRQHLPRRGRDGHHERDRERAGRQRPVQHVALGPVGPDDRQR